MVADGAPHAVILYICNCSASEPPKLAMGSTGEGDRTRKTSTCTTKPADRSNVINAIDFTLTTDAQRSLLLPLSTLNPDRCLCTKLKRPQALTQLTGVGLVNWPAKILGLRLFYE